MRSIRDRLAFARRKSRGRGSGPRSVSSSMRILSSLSASGLSVSPGAGADLQAITRCVFRFLAWMLSRNSIRPSRWSFWSEETSRPSFVCRANSVAPRFSFSFARNATSSVFKPREYSLPPMLPEAASSDSVKTICRCVFSSVSGGSKVRKTSPMGTREKRQPGCRTPKWLRQNILQDSAGAESSADEENSCEDGGDSNPLPAGDMFAKKNGSEPYGDSSIERAKNADDGNVLQLHAAVAEHKSESIKHAHAERHPARAAARQAHGLRRRKNHRGGKE